MQLLLVLLFSIVVRRVHSDTITVNQTGNGPNAGTAAYTLSTDILACGLPHTFSRLTGGGGHPWNVKRTDSKKSEYVLLTDLNYGDNRSFVVECATCFGILYVAECTSHPFPSMYNNLTITGCTKPQNCETSTWSQCSAECGGGTKTRNVTKQSSGGGNICPQLREPCNVQDCDVVTIRVGITTAVEVCKGDIVRLVWRGTYNISVDGSLLAEEQKTGYDQLFVGLGLDKGLRKKYRAGDGSEFEISCPRNQKWKTVLVSSNAIIVTLLLSGGVGICLVVLLSVWMCLPYGKV